MSEENNSSETSNAQLSLDLGTNKEGSATTMTPNGNGQFAEPSDTVFQNGMRWLRADFHLHTKADKEFTYNYNGEEEKKDKKFIEEYIARLKAEDVKIGIITNHNKFDIKEYKKLRKAAKKEGIWIVPGTELSIKDSTHCLIVFDESSWVDNKENKDYIDQFLESAFEGKADRESGNGVCRYHLEELLKKLDERRGEGKDSFIVFAHVEDDKGFLKDPYGIIVQEISRDDLFKKYVLGLQKVRTRDTVERCKQWFGRPLPAFVEGSDCKSIEEVGKAPTQGGHDMKTYVKIGDFNFVALKYALFDHENRIKSEPQVPKNAYIKSIHFEGRSLDGQTINFSPELNNLIGIRGSGKSAIIEAIRYALDISLSSTPSATDINYKERLVKHILGSGGKITLSVVDKNGKEYKIKRFLETNENCMYDKYGNKTNYSIKAIFDTILYFGQKDLSSKDKNGIFESDLLNKFIGSNLKTISDKIEIKKQEITNIVLDIKKLEKAEELSKEEIETRIENTNKKLSDYEEKGVWEKLKKKTQIDADLLRLRGKKETFEKYLNDIDKIIQDYEAFFSEEISVSEENNDIINEANSALQKAKSEFEKLKLIHNATNDILNEYSKSILELESKDREMQDEFAQIKRELDEGALDPDEFLILNNTKNSLDLKLKQVETSEEEKAKLRKKLRDEVSELEELWKYEYDLLKQEATKTTSGELQIEINFKGQKDKFLEKMKETFKGTGIRDNVYQKLSQSYPDFIGIYLAGEDDLKTIITESQFTDLKRIFEEKLGDLLTFDVNNEILIKYKGKALSMHSLGQRASALILFLLSQKETNVLIIDQPEDDLDNQTIYDEVIKAILRRKGEMQFIFATHNANIPVLGDSEKIVACSFDNPDKISLEQGTIDSRRIQDSIVKIMEGGEEAFSKRKERYNLWKPHKTSGK